MGVRPLTSTHLNYLIWRYLQESGHGEAAVKLQRDWNPDPQSLTIAPHVKTHELVSLVQKGLQYHEIERSISSQARHSSLIYFYHSNRYNGDRNLPSAASTYFFGPESDRSMQSPKGEGMDEDDDDNVACVSTSSPRSRKHGRESGSNGVLIDITTQAPAPKRYRKSNGVVETSSNGEGNEYGNGNVDGNAMEIDRNGYTHPRTPTAAESPTGAAGVEPADDDNAQTSAHAQASAQAQAQAEAEAKEATTRRMTLTNGTSVGVQSEKIAELGPETTILDLRDDNNEAGILSANLDRGQRGNGNGRGGQSVMHTTWHPKELTVLATAGEALARIWTVSRSDSPTTRQYVDLLEQEDRSLVTAISWSPDGEFLAVATRHLVSSWIGKVTIWTKEGVMRDELPAAHDMMLALRWNPPASRLLGVASSGDNSSILVWDRSTGQALQPVELEETLLDAAWTGDMQYSVCGEDTVINFVINSDHTTSVGHHYQDQELRQNWGMIRWDSVSKITALAADDSASLAILYPWYNVQTTTAYFEPLTALLFQPHPNPSAYSTSETRLLATASMDGIIKLWDATRPFNIVHQLSLGHRWPAMALSFTPDGYLIAAAGYNKILIWRAEEGGLPKARWVGKKGRWLAGYAAKKGEKREGGDDKAEEEKEERSEDHSLSWDADGGKLAFGLGSQIAIINFRR